MASEERLHDAIRAADEFVRAQRPASLRLVEQEASWHDRPPTDKQLQLLKRSGVTIPEGVTRGQVARMISLLLASRGATRPG